ncbi:MAG: TraB/GumN family protein [Chitinophagaceae bacterium]|nr:TraB/GumN family protein [Chitinophagaceae bacterium]
MFKVTEEGSNMYGYLLGTMHMICAHDFIIKPKVISALRKCSIYLMEVDLGNPGEMQAMAESQSALGGMAEDLTEKQRAELENIMQEKLGIPAEYVEEVSPLAVINKLTMDAMGCDEVKVPEIELVQIALKLGLRTGGLETAHDQFEIAQKVFTGKEMLHQLRSAGDYDQLFNRISTAYHNENLMELASLVTDKRFMSRHAFQTLVTSRNRKWARLIPKLIKKEKPFIAIGAGHLPGENGVIQLLREKEFRVNPVYR